MTIKEFFTKLNSLAQYALGVANTNKGKMKIFIKKLKADIIKDMLIGDKPLKSYTEAVGRVQQSKAITMRMAKEREKKYRFVL